MSKDTVPANESSAVNNTAGTSEKTNRNPVEIEWAYSGKAMRGRCILYWLITIAVFAVGIFLSSHYNKYYLPIWIGTVILTAILWVHFYSIYFYRTWTIRYKLTDLRLYTYKGFFTKTQDTMELVFVEDIQLTQTLWDRLFNGGVGTIKVYSGTDKTNPRPDEGGNSILVISGIDDPKTKFELMDNIRSELRKRRAMLQASS